MTSLLMSRELTMLPGATELLAEVRPPESARPGHVVGAADHGRRAGQLGVSFTATVCADDVRGPSPTRNRTCGPPRCWAPIRERCVALEDSPNGVASAEAAGCRLVAVPSLVPIPPGPAGSSPPRSARSTSPCCATSSGSG